MVQYIHKSCSYPVCDQTCNAKEELRTAKWDEKCTFCAFGGVCIVCFFPYLWYSWATCVRSEGPDQRDGQEREEQSPDDVHQVVDYVGKRTLKRTQTHNRDIRPRLLINTRAKSCKLQIMALRRAEKYHWFYFYRCCNRNMIHAPNGNACFCIFRFTGKNTEIMVMCFLLGNTRFLTSGEHDLHAEASP